MLPGSRNGVRFKRFVERYFPEPLKGQADSLWKLRNAAVHGFSPGPYALTHRNTRAHLKKANAGNCPITLNAENFYATVVTAASTYFYELAENESLQTSFQVRIREKDTGVLVIAPTDATPWRESP